MFVFIKAIVHNLKWESDMSDFCDFQWKFQELNIEHSKHVLESGIVNFNELAEQLAISTGSKSLSSFFSSTTVLGIVSYK